MYKSIERYKHGYGNTLYKFLHCISVCQRTLRPGTKLNKYSPIALASEFCYCITILSSLMLKRNRSPGIIDHCFTDMFIANAMSPVALPSWEACHAETFYLLYVTFIRFLCRLSIYTTNRHYIVESVGINDSHGSQPWYLMYLRYTQN